jgi:hypothetical protein
MLQLKHPHSIRLRPSKTAAGPEPARQIGTAAANEVARAHEVSILMAAKALRSTGVSGNGLGNLIHVGHQTGAME